MSVSGEEIQIHVQLNIRGTNDYQGIHSYLDIDFYQWHSYKFERKIPYIYSSHINSLNVHMRNKAKK